MFPPGAAEKTTVSGAGPEVGEAENVSEAEVFGTHRGLNWHPSVPYPPPTSISFALQSGGMNFGQSNGVSFPTTTEALVCELPESLDTVNAGR